MTLSARLAAPVAAALALSASLAQAQFHVESSNLGCTNGAGGVPVTCTVGSVFEDQDLEFTFSQPIDLASFTTVTFRVRDFNTGLTAPGVFFTAPGDPRTLVFRPTLTFDGQGNAVYGFQPNASYQLLALGTAQMDPGPFVRSASGEANLSRLNCLFVASLGRLGPIQPTCATSPNSVGPGAELIGSGSSSLAAANLGLSVVSAPPGEVCLFFVGVREVRTPLGAGRRCIGSPLARLGPALVTDAAGGVTRAVDLNALPPAVAGAASAGRSLFFQLWYRDGAGANLSGGTRVAVFP